MSTPPDSKPPEGGWPHVRTDAGARVVVERLDEVKADVGKVRAELERVAGEVEGLQRKQSSYVTLGWLVGVLGTAGVILVGASYSIAKDTRAESQAADQRLADDLRQVRAETAGKTSNTEAKVDAVYKHLIEGASKRSVAADVRSATEAKP